MLRRALINCPPSFREISQLKILSVQCRQALMTTRQGDRAERPKRKPSAEALPKQIGHLDEEGAAIAAEAGLKLAREWTEAVVR